MTYQEAVDYLHNRINYERIPPTRYALRLERMQQLLELLGNPQLQIPAIHIAGTKGKGSTSVMLARMLTATGERTGLFTSPHVHRLEERFQVDGESPGEAEFIGLVELLREAVERLGSLAPEHQSTFFEMVTALGWLFFRQRRCDRVVLETGLGGRLDATNLCRPEVCIVTSIGYDHMELLGETLEEIAGEKAGIVKPGVPVISGVTVPGPAAVIARAALRQQSPFYQLGQSIRVVLDQELTHISPDGHEIVRVTTPWRAWPWLPVPLAGVHQRGNLALAVTALDQLSRAGLAVTSEQAFRGLQAVRWPVRFEIMRQRPAIVLDAAHNPESLQALCQTLREKYPDRRKCLILSISRNKPIPQMLAALRGQFDLIILTQFRNNPRACPVEELLPLLAAAELAPLTAAATPAEALAQATRWAGEDDVICGSGSIFLAAELRELLLRDEA